MTPDEAKFLLRARRPGDRDAGDPAFAEALKAAEADPVLKTWHAREERRDAALAAKLGEIAPPPGLREAILAGARASESRGRGNVIAWRHPVWLAVAAAVAILMSVAMRPTDAPALSVERLATAAVHDLGNAHASHVGVPGRQAALKDRLASVSLPLREGVGRVLNLEELRDGRCRSVRIAGREVFEICFQREGVWFHLYATAGGSGTVMSDQREVATAHGEMAVATWRDAKHTYALVTMAGRDALRRVL